MTYVMMCDVREQTFGQRIRDRREELELSQEKAAELAGLGVDTWRTTERGYKARSGVDPATSTHRPVRITVRKIAKALGWTPEQALTWAGYDEPITEPVAEPQPRQDPRAALLNLIPDLQQRHVQLLFELAQTMLDPDAGNDPAVRYTHRIVDTPREAGQTPIPSSRDGNDITP